MRKNGLLRSCLAMALCACMLLGVMGNMTVAFAGYQGEDLIIDLNGDFYYVAIVDEGSKNNTASYADKIAAQLGCSYVKTSVEDVNAIAQADLITVGFTQNEVMSFMVQQVKAYSLASFGGTYTPCDWSLLLGQGDLEIVEEIKTQMQDRISSMNLGSMSAYAIVAVDAYAYAYVSQLLNIARTVETITAMNPETVVVLVGQYNPVEGAVLTAGADVLPMDEYIQNLVNMFNEKLLAYTVTNDNIVYADASDVETVRESRGETLNMPVTGFIMSLLSQPAKMIGDMYPSENGHEYMKDQIMQALIATEKPEGPEVPEQPEEPAVTLSGDADGNGVVNNIDAMLVLQAYAGLGVTVDAAAADVDGNGVVNNIDAMLILQQYAGLITEFPAGE